MISQCTNIPNTQHSWMESRCFWTKKRKALFAWVLSMIIFLALLWPHIVISIPPGHSGVLYRRYFGGTEMQQVYREGTNLIFPWDKMYIFDIRLHNETHRFEILDNNGLSLAIDVSILYQPEVKRLPILLTNIGEDYQIKLVTPIMTAAVRSISANYNTSEFFSGKLTNEMADKMLINMIESIGRSPIAIQGLFIRRVYLPQEMAAAVQNKMVTEQKIFKKQYEVGLAIEEFKRQYVMASATRMTQELINENLTENFLRWQGIEATRALAKSNNSKIVLFGGKDGLPVILNLDSNSAPIVDNSTKTSRKNDLKTRGMAVPNIDDSFPNQIEEGDGSSIIVDKQNSTQVLSRPNSMSVIKDKSVNLGPVANKEINTWLENLDEESLTKIGILLKEMIAENSPSMDTAK